MDIVWHTWLENSEFGTITGNFSGFSKDVVVSPTSTTCPSIDPACIIIFQKTDTWITARNWKHKCSSYSLASSWKPFVNDKHVQHHVMDTDDYSPQKILIFVTFKIDNINNIRVIDIHKPIDC